MRIANCELRIAKWFLFLILFLAPCSLLPAPGFATCTNTTNLSLCKPARGDADWDTNINANFDKLDNPIKLQIDSGAIIEKYLSNTASLDFTALAASSCEVLTIIVTGATDGNVVTLGVPNALADVDGATERTTFFAWVSAADTVSVRRCNPTAAATADPAAATVRVGVWQH